jgi:RNA polymerase sigma factor (sigma-70 family)
VHDPGLARQFEQHLSEHEGLLHKVCRMYAYTATDREDLFQEIAAQLWRAYGSFNGLSSLSTWIYRVAINTAITGLRKKKDFIKTYEPSELPEKPDESSRIEEERLQDLYKAIGQLNDVEKAITMLYMEDKNYAEMEEILGISQGTLRVKMNRIREKLRQLTKTTDYGA